MTVHREIHRIELSSGEALSIRFEEHDFTTYLVLESASGLTDYPVLYNDGRMALDHPERYTSELKRKARTIMVQWRKHATNFEWQPAQY